MEIFNELCTSSKQQLEHSTSAECTKKRKISYYRQRKRNQNGDYINENEESGIFLDFDEDNEDDEDGISEEEDGKKSYKKKNSKRKRLTDEELLKDLSDLSNTFGVALHTLEKGKRLPAQQRVFDELTSINSNIASLVQVRQMGLSTPENTQQLKKLVKDRRKKVSELERLQRRQRISNKSRVKQRKIVIFFF